MAAKDIDLARLAAAHHGIFTLEHARSVGFTDHEIKQRRSFGSWIRVYECAYRIAGAPVLWRGDLLAACWAGGFRAHASHRSAAALWKLPGGSRVFAEVTCPRWRRARHAGLFVHETKASDPRDVVLVESIPVSTPSRTLLDLGAVRGRRTVELAVEAALHRRIVTLGELREVLRRLGRPGRNGAGVLRSVLAVRDPGATPTESPMETRVLQVLRDHGLPEPQRQFVIRRDGCFIARVDLAYPQWRIAIEYESFEWHLGAEAIVHNSARRNAIVGERWAVFSATAADIRAEGVRLCRAVRAVASSFGVDNGV